MSRIKIVLPNDQSIDKQICDLRKQFETASGEGGDNALKLQAVEDYLLKMHEKSTALEQEGTSVMIERTFDLTRGQVSVVLQLPRKPDHFRRLLSFLGIR